MGKYTNYIIFGGLALIVLYALSRIKKPEVQQVPEFIGSNTISQSPSQEARDQTRLGAISALASVAQTETESRLARYTTDAQLKATEIASGLQQSIATGQYQTRQAEIASAERMQAAGLEVSRFGIQSDLQRYLASLSTQENLYQADLTNRLASYQQQLAAVERTAYQYRGQSLERAGTYLNAVLAAGGQQPAYNYVSAFGGPRGPSVLSQLLNAGQNILGMFL